MQHSKRGDGSPFQLGAVSHGTLLPEHVLPVLADHLRECADWVAGLLCGPWGDSLEAEGGFNGARVAVHVARDMADEVPAALAEDVDSWEPGDLWCELVDRLNDLAFAAGVGDRMYFGAHEGDGSDFGWWPTQDEDGE